MRAVNLLQDDGRRLKDGPKRSLMLPVAIGGGGLLVVAVALVGFVFVQGRSTVSDKRDTLTAVEQQVTDAQTRATGPDTAAGGDQLQLAAFNAAAAGRISWDTLLGDLAKALPAGSWVSNLAMHIPVAPVAVAPVPTDTTATGTTTISPTITPPAVPVADPTTFVISGVALSHDLVVRVMQRLALVPMLSNVSLQTSQEADIGTKKAFQFSMNAVLRAAGATG